jgi:hypothetical protein
VHELEPSISWHSVTKRDVVDAEAFLSYLGHFGCPLFSRKALFSAGHCFRQGTVFTARCLSLLDAFHCSMPSTARCQARSRGFAASAMLESRTPHGRRTFSVHVFLAHLIKCGASLPDSTVENRSFVSIYEAFVLKTVHEHLDPIHVVKSNSKKKRVLANPTHVAGGK